MKDAITKKEKEEHLIEYFHEDISGSQQSLFIFSDGRVRAGKSNDVSSYFCNASLEEDKVESLVERLGKLLPQLKEKYEISGGIENWFSITKIVVNYQGRRLNIEYENDAPAHELRKIEDELGKLLFEDGLEFKPYPRP